VCLFVSDMFEKKPPKFSSGKKTVSFSVPDWDFKLLGLIFFFLLSLILFFVLLGVTLSASGGDSGSVLGDSGDPVPVSLSVSLDNVRSLGSDSAPVVVVKYSDFRCGYCGRFALETKPAIESEYVDSGKVRFVYKDYAVLGPDSLLAGVAGWCANDQGRFWEFHDALFSSPADRGEDYSSYLSGVARGVGLDVSKFNSCLSGGSKDSLVSASSSEAASNGFRGTPSFIIMKSDGSSKQTIPGALPFADFKVVIDSLLN